jgi:hypothetical protein
MSEIMRRSDLARTSQVVRIDRNTSKALTSLQGDAMVREAEEYVLARIAQLRIDVAHQLGTRAVVEMTGLHGLITELTRDKPGLEMELRAISGIVNIGVQQILASYVMRQL